jgi:predicted nucleic acid-binding Zn ribbon protein
VSPWKPLDDGREPRPVKASLDRVVHKMGGPKAASLEAVFEGWAGIVGDAVAGHARPRSLRNGTLVVDVDDPAWASELRFLGPQILDRCAAAAGADTVRRIEVKVTP